MKRAVMLTLVFIFIGSIVSFGQEISEEAKKYYDKGCAALEMIKDNEPLVDYNDAIKEFKARLLASPKSRKVLDSILDAALDDEHKNQSAAWKLLMDRMLPISYFDKDKEGGSRAAVNITISGVGGETINIGGNNSSEDDIIDGEYSDAE